MLNASSIRPLFFKRLRLLRRVFTNGVISGGSLGPIVTHLTGTVLTINI